MLLADGPAGSIDEQTRDEIIGLLEKVWREHQMTMVVVTHDRGVAAQAQRSGQMSNGTYVAGRELTGGL